MPGRDQSTESSAIETLIFVSRPAYLQLFKEASSKLKNALVQDFERALVFLNLCYVLTKSRYIYLLAGTLRTFPVFLSL